VAARRPDRPPLLHFRLLVGEVARRVTGRSVRRVPHDRVSAPLGIVGELYFGVPPAELVRLARLEDAAPHPAEPAEHGSILAPWERRSRASMGNSPGFLQADVPSVGTFTARGIATVCAAVPDGRLIAAHQPAELSAVAFEGTDQVLGNPTRLAWATPRPRHRTRLDHVRPAGGGGGYVYAATGMSFAVTRNRLTSGFATVRRRSDAVTAGLCPLA
jgi:CubicO group peptidase (beta-lactamase class C family)